MLSVKGHVSWFNQEKGFGFAVPDTVAMDILIDVNILDTPTIDLQQGTRVYMEIEAQQDGGYKAMKVVALS